MRGIKIPLQDIALKMQGGLMREGGGGAYLRDTTVYVPYSSKFSRDNIFMNFVINLEITKILFTKLEVTRWPI